MNVYLECNHHSYGIERVVSALKEYTPSGFVHVPSAGEADLVIFHVNGRRDHVARAAQQIKESGRQYAIIQYVLESCRNPDPRDWLEIWQGARVVWSYYDLPALNLYLAPLAADPEVFYIESIEKKWIVGTNGNSYQAECYGEVRAAAYRNQERIVHIGPELAPDPNMDRFENIADDELRGVYNQCKWFSALRRKDGFEMIAVEALFCGVRPIMFDAPRFRRWFDGLAEFIPEDSPGSVVYKLTELLAKEPAPADREEALRRFNWGEIVGGFWERCNV